MDNQRLELLFNKYILRQCTPAEVEEFVHLLDKHDDGGDDNILSQPMKDLWEEMKENPAEYHVNWNKMFSNVIHSEDQVNAISYTGKRRIPWFRYAAAAVLVFAIATTYFIYTGSHEKPGPQAVHTPAPLNDIPPGGNKAVLTLADGSVIVLDDAQNGSLTNQQGTTVTKTHDGQVVYTISEKPTTASISYNTISTPRGGQYQVVLPDGTHVWLNTASSVKFPTAFIGNQRTVEVTGEAYFEVAKDRSKPFHVLTKDQDVEVFGTHFNINAYDDEDAVRTTLLEGSVRVTASGKGSVVLKPGVQSIRTNEKLGTRNGIDIDEVMAWKNGEFSFRRTPLSKMMLQLGRWYNINIQYNNPTLAEMQFTGRFSRSLNLSEVLQIIKATQTVQLHVVDDKLIIDEKE